MKLAAFLCAISLVSTIAGAADVATYEPLRRAYDGEPATERAQLEQSLESYERAGDGHGAALARLLLAMWDLDAGKLEQAQAMLQAESDVLGASMALWFLARLDREAGRYDMAIQRHERSLAWICEMETAPFHIEQVLPLAVMLGKSEGIENEPPAILKVGFHWMAECFTRISHGQALTGADRFQEAEAELFEASMISRRLRGIADDEIASALGDLRVRQGRLEDAYASYLDALRKSAGSLEVVRKLIAVDAARGAIPDALEWSEAAEERARVTNKTAEVIDILIERGALLANAARFDEADSVFQKALAAANQQPDRDLTARIFFARAMVSLSRGAWARATTDLEHASAIHRDLGRPTEQGIAIALQALPLFRLGMQKEAEKRLNDSKDLFATNKSPVSDALLEFLTALLHAETGGGTAQDVIAAIAKIEALPESQRAFFGDSRTLMLFRAMVGDDASLEVLRDGKPIAGAPPAALDLLQAVSVLNQGQFAAARTLFLKALDGNLAADLRAQIAAGVAVTYWWEGNVDESVRYLAQAADALEIGIEDLPNQESLIVYLGSYRRHILDGLLEYQIEHGRPEDAFGLAERARARAFLQQIGGGATKLPRRSSEFGSLISVTPSGLTAIRSELPPDTAMIVYFISPRRMHTWVLDRDNVHHVARAMDSQTLERIACWGRSHQPDKSSPLRTPIPLVPNPQDPLDHPQCKQDNQATAAEVFEELIAPIEPHLVHPRLIIVPHGGLHHVPFAAIPDGRTPNRYLIERYTITYAPSASAIRFLHAMETPVEGGALVVGDPPNSRLEYATEEAVEVAKAFGVTPHLEKNACETLLYDFDHSADVVHFSTHGVYELDDPMASYISLAPCDGHDGNLTAKEIAERVDLRGVNLVVLSACSTSTGTPTGGDEMLGLTRALLSAGTPGVISTLWKVSDLASNLLMIKFYEHLLEGCSAADALRAAQLDMLHGDDTLHASPSYWAAFSLHGDPQARWSRRAAP